MLCLVNLPNGTTFGIQCDPKAIGQKCLEEVSLAFRLLIFCPLYFCFLSEFEYRFCERSAHYRLHQRVIPALACNRLTRPKR